MLTNPRRYPKSSIARISARDRRRAAVHEAGHAVIGEEVGVCDGLAWIVTNAGVDDPLREKLWIGQFLGIPRSLPTEQAMMIAVAGCIAETVWFECEWFDDYLLDPNCMSPSDWGHTGCEPGEPSHELCIISDQVYDLLRRDGGKLWPDLIKETRKLILEAVSPTRRLTAA